MTLNDGQIEELVRLAETQSAKALVAYVRRLLAAERAAVVAECAKVCDDAVCTYNSNEQDMLAKQLAFLIRARKDA